MVLKFIKKQRLLLFLLITVVYFQTINKSVAQETDTSNFTQFKGVVQDSNSKKTLEFANLTVNGTNISTITNTEGKFVFKVPKKELNKQVTITYLGYFDKVIPLSDFLKGEKNVIKLRESVEQLPDVKLGAANPILIIKKTLENRKKNSFEKPVIMQAFYRETIKKRRTYVSLSEAVVTIYKQPFESKQKDYAKLNRARKSTDYRKIDTLLLKLQGGPYNNLGMDFIKNEDIFFTKDIFEVYDFTFDKTISMNNKTVYVLNFKQKASIVEPYYQGKLYIDTQNYVLIKAAFHLNIENLEKASKYFVKKKPKKASVIPIKTSYVIDYRNSKGKWYFGYSRIALSFKVDWNKKLFNSIYHLTIEMATTDWKWDDGIIPVRQKEKLKQNVILSEKATGFSDPEFWGKYNVIEPEKSIENAIKKIRRQLKK